MKTPPFMLCYISRDINGLDHVGYYLDASQLNLFFYSEIKRGAFLYDIYGDSFWGVTLLM